MLSRDAATKQISTQLSQNTISPACNTETMPVAHVLWVGGYKPKARCHLAHKVRFEVQLETVFIQN